MKAMEKQMTREECEALQKKCGLQKRSLHERQAFLTEMTQFMSKRSCTPSEDYERRKLMAHCKKRIFKNSGKINDLNTRIYRLSQSEKGDLTQ